MTSIFRNLGPLAAVFAAVAWLCWEELNRPALPETGRETITKIDTKLLTPDLPPPGTRDPLTAVAPPVAETPPRRPALAQGKRPAADAGEASMEVPSVKFKLRGTYLAGPRKSALIDGYVCFEGECLPAKSSSGGESFRLTEVERDHVVLRLQDQEIRLEYSP